MTEKTDKPNAEGDPDAERESADSRVRAGLLLIRLSAFVLVLGGFFGALSRDVSPVAGDSMFSLAFFAGIACAVASIYLGIFLQNDH